MGSIKQYFRRRVLHQYSCSNKVREGKEQPQNPSFPSQQLPNSLHSEDEENGAQS